MGVNFDQLREKAVDVAQCAAQKTKTLAAITKAKFSILTEEDKIRKAQTALGKLYYRDYVLEEEMDSAEYLPWCDKITESRGRIEELRDLIEELKSEDAAETIEDTEEYA